VKATVDAVFEDGVFKPVSRPNLVEGDRVRITVETVQQAKPDVILKLAAHVYEGLSPKDIDEIEEMARHGPFFGDAHP
jgi:predicted DNA-binding antitoxin AbrB/MazE fold protein